MAGSSKRDLECVKILFPRNYEEKLELPAAMAKAIGLRWELELRRDDARSLARWPVEVFTDAGDNGRLYPGQGWGFARAHDLRDRYTLAMRYDIRRQIHVKVYDLSTCRKQYLHDSEAGGSRHSLAIPDSPNFTVVLKKYHLKSKYLILPKDFEKAHEYQKLHVVEPQMARHSWWMALGTEFVNKFPHPAFQAGWHCFLAENHLDVGDTCFFNVVCEATCSNDNDEEWEDANEADDAKLRVQVRRKDGTLLS